MKIAFVTCGTMGFPAGGFKVILEYANRFTALGNKVDIILCATTVRLKANFAALYRYPLHKIKDDFSPRQWFFVNDSIKIKYFFSLNKKILSCYNVIIATNVDSSYIVKKNAENQRLFYLIQGFEDWSVSKSYVLKSYKLSLENIVIAPWLKELLERHNAFSEYIPNGFDFSYFHKYINIEDRDKFTVLMMYHQMERKRCCDAIHALQIVKNKYPNLKIIMFGQPNRPTDIPLEFSYYQTPDRDLHNRLYNEASIYIAASSVEGWGLTIGEAMICGCAVACTDNDGFKIMAKQNETALLSQVYDYNALAENIIKLIENDDLRYEIAKRAHQEIQKYTWESSCKKFIALINK